MKAMGRGAPCRPREGLTAKGHYSESLKPPVHDLAPELKPELWASRTETTRSLGKHSAPSHRPQLPPGLWPSSLGVKTPQMLPRRSHNLASTLNLDLGKLRLRHIKGLKFSKPAQEAVLPRGQERECSPQKTWGPTHLEVLSG